MIFALENTMLMLKTLHRRHGQSLAATIGSLGGRAVRAALNLDHVSAAAETHGVSN